MSGLTPWELVFGHLSAALGQAVEADDEIIIGHVKEACEIARQEMRLERDMRRDLSTQPLSDSDKAMIDAAYRCHVEPTDDR